MCAWVCLLMFVTLEVNRKQSNNIRNYKLDSSFHLSIKYVPWVQFSNRSHQVLRWHPTTMYSSTSRSCMPATTRKCLEASPARTPQALRRSKTASPTAPLGIRWLVACRTTTTSGSDATKSPSRYLAASSHRLMNSRNTGPTINCRWLSSWPRLTEVFKDLCRTKAADQSRKHRWRSKVATLDFKRRSTANFGEFSFPASTDLRFA